MLRCAATGVRHGPAALLGSSSSSSASSGKGTAGGSSLVPVEPRGDVDFQDGDDPTVRRHWALIVAGSSSWGNYRHQADAYHAYRVLLNGGLQPQHVVLMAFDDIAHDPQNPYPGQVFNKPGACLLLHVPCA